MFEIGQQVVCVDAEWGECPLLEPDLSFPAEGVVYTVRGFDPCYPEEHPSIFLEEIVNPQKLYDLGFGEASFCASQFAPLCKTDISIFTAMLTPVKQTERV